MLVFLDQRDVVWLALLLCMVGALAFVGAAALLRAGA